MYPDNTQAAQSIYPPNTEANGLMKLANLISEANDRIDNIGNQLSMAANGIHGPRPEPVSDSGASIKGAAATTDSLASRIHQLLQSVDRLQRSADSILR